jgi:O-antigen/teichoic acid export membrane protein
MKKNKNLNTSLKLIVKSSLIIFMGIFISKILTYAYRVIIARKFGPEAYGLFSLSLMIVGWFIALSSLGLIEGIVRNISLYRGKNELNKISYVIRSSLTFLVFSTLIAGFVLFIFSDYIALTFFHNANLAIFLKLFSITIPLVLLSGIFLSVLQSFEKIQWFSFIRNILSNSVQLGALLILISFGFGTGAIIASYIIGLLTLLLASYFIALSKIPIAFKKYYMDSKTKSIVLSNLFSYSWPLILSSLIMTLFVEIDSFTIGYFKTIAEVGVYNSAVPIAVLLGLVPALIIPLFFPLITKEFAKKNKETIKQISKQVVKWIFILNLPLVILMVIFPGVFINLLFGPNYLAAINSLRFLSIGFFFYSIFIISENLLSMAGKTKIVLINTFFVAVTNLVLNIVLVPKYGIDGAAFSTMISYILWGLLSFLQTNHYLSMIPLRKKMFRILLISIIPTLLLIYIKQFVSINPLTLFIQGSLFLLLYIFLIFYFKGLDENDIMILNSIKKKIYKT